MTNRFEEIKAREQEWKEGTVNKALKRFPLLKESPSRFYSPLDMKEDFDFLGKVGFPGEYPHTAGTYAFNPEVGMARLAAKDLMGKQLPLRSLLPVRSSS